jgi:transposase
MALASDSLPDNIEGLRAFAIQAVAERDAAIAERDEAIARNDRLRHLLHKANDALYGSKSERLAKLPVDQLNLALEDIEQAIAKNDAVEDKKTPGTAASRPKRQANRGSLPAHMPRVHETITPGDTNCPCCRAPMHVIGEETSERLDVIPAQFRVIVTHRPKLACRACEKIVEAAAPEHLIKSGLPTEALVAHVLVAKYGWHLPLYRQAQMFLTQGIKLDRSTLAFWVGYAAAELMPLHERMRTILLASAKLAVDETTVPVLDPGRGRTKTGYFWTMARDDRPWGGPDPPCVVYTYAPGRGSVHATTLLADYHGIVQCDGYRAYKIEETVRGRPPDERRAVRQEKSKPQVMALRDWLETQLSKVSAKSPIAEAIRYGLNHWDGLVRFLDDGRIELDTNIVERSMRPVALTRKNALFAGHDDGAENWACIASLIETCKLQGIDPQAYLADVLTCLVNLWPNNRLDELLPWTWADARRPKQRAA